MPRVKLNSSLAEGKDKTSTSQNPLELQVLTKEPPETALGVRPRSCAGMWWLYELVQGQGEDLELPAFSPWKTSSKHQLCPVGHHTGDTQPQ